LDPALIHIFSYGYKEDEGERIYNNEGDIREIASRLSPRDGRSREDLECQVDRLSRKSVAMGGPPGVTLIAHSMGGLGCRCYLSQGQPAGFGTPYCGNVASLIQLATPTLGVDFARIITLIPPDSIIWHVLRWLERLLIGRPGLVSSLAAIEQQVEQLQQEAFEAQFGSWPRGYLDSPAVRQMAPGSDFLRSLNRPENIPPGVECYTLYGDIRFGVSVFWGRLPLWGRSVSFGDLLVPAHSAREIPGARAMQLPYNWEREWTIRIDQELFAGRESKIGRASCRERG